MPMYNKPYQNTYGEYIFSDYPNFRPNLSPAEIMSKGAFGKTYFRPIYSSVIGKVLKNDWKKFPKEIFKNISVEDFTTPYEEYDKDYNKYGVKTGTTLEFWESKKWIVPPDYRGWFAWYCHFFYGRRIDDDTRQIKRWVNFSGPKGRFRIWLINDIKRAGGKRHINNYEISPKKRQNLLEWGYELTTRDYNSYLS